MNFRSYLFSIFLTISLIISLQLSAAEKFSYVGTISYLDGTPAISTHLDNYEIINLKSNTSYTRLKTIKKDTIFIDFVMAGEYVLTFMNFEVAKFQVTESNGKLQSNIPKTLKLPFNYVVIGEPNQIVKIFDDKIQLIETLKANNKGVVALKGDVKYFANKFIVGETKEGFPQPVLFKQVNPSRKGDFDYRKFGIPKQKLIPQKGLVHNIQDDIYYSVQKVTFSNKDNSIFVLKKYDARQNKGSIHKVNLPNSLSQNGGSIALDFNGKLVFYTNKQCYYLNADGSLSKEDEIYIDPIYRFNNIFVKGHYWIAPLFLNIPLKEGRHVFKITCKGSWNDANQAHIDWGIKKDELADRIYHPEPGTKRTAEQSSALQKEYAELVKREPKPSVFSHEGEITSQEYFEVIFDPNEPNLWKMDGDYNSYKLTDPERKYYPSGLDPESKIYKMDLKECFISVDGSDPIPYSHIDPSIFKGIFYAYDDEEERKAAMESARKNATVNLGLSEDIEAWQDSYFNLFNQDYQVDGPINRYEGPYPELRYKVSKKLGEYKSFDEAKKHCDKPIRYYGKYRCVETSIVSVCPDNYRFTVDEDGIKTDYNALYCGDVDTEDNELKGEEIVVVFSKEGYITETRALSKRTLEAANILLSGHVTDKDGIEIDSAQIKLKGVDGAAVTDDAGIYNLMATALGEESYSEVMDVKLQKIDLEISNEELGKYKENEPFGIVADGFTTLKIKVKAKGIDPRTVIVKQPELGQFVEQTMLKLPLVLDENGEGEMEYVPPNYLKNEQLNKHLQLKVDEHNMYGLSKQIWVAEVPIIFTYEDEEWNTISDTIKIFVTRPPILLIHGFTGNETTWTTLANYLRVRKYEPIVREYYQGPADESTIQRQSQKLGFYVQKLRDCYKKNNIIQTRVDIVAHSMGGLISRYYISNMAKLGKKAGIYIPYDVKLSGDELAAQRFKKPVILNDVRKLIMVGTPNHGASKIDEIIGTLGAVMSDYHQVANGQLRSDSPFFKELNAGENEGRHLNPNVQYALLYGIRKRSEFYPIDRLWYPIKTSQKEFADNDGVVSVSSAKLNGILNIPFPKDWFAMHGFIHSPALEPFFMGDEAITESSTIFDEIDILLQKDIKRTPLSNSSAKIIRTTGETYLRYFSTEDWKPIESLNSKNLRDHWCQMKTVEGTASLGFFLNGHHWGSLHIENNSIIFYEYASPEFVKIYLQKGKARFRSRKKSGGGFEIVMGDEGEKWYSFNPKAKVRDLNTDFIVEVGETISVQSIAGKTAIGVPDKNGKNIIAKEINKNEGVIINKSSEIIDNPLPESGWWSDIDTAFLNDEIIKEKISTVTTIDADTSNIKIDTAENAITLQNIGEVELYFQDAYLPVSGFTNLKIVAKNEFGEKLVSPYKIKIILENEKLLQFIDISVPEGIIDEFGNFNTDITISEPDPNNYKTLDEVPLNATFKVQFLNPQNSEITFEKLIKIPIGMTLLYGQTIGPDYKARREPMPPEFKATTYQIANQTDEKGNFYVLFNTTLFEKNIEKFKKLAERTQQIFNMDQFDFSLHWSESCSLPLNYILPDSIRNKLKAAKKIKVGKNGLIDLLSAEEQEQRIKNLVALFIEQMPLKPDKKSFVLSKLNSLMFRYGFTTSKYPEFKDKFCQVNIIDAPLSKEKYWSKEFINGKENPSFNQMMHVIGHFLHNCICLEDFRNYSFLSNKCNGSEKIWIHQRDAERNIFDKSEYISFSESGADFFTYLMYQFILKSDKEFALKSIYYQAGYLPQFEDKDKAIQTKQKYPIYSVSGVQTAFFVNYYGEECFNNPANVYSDFLLTQALYSKLTIFGEPAMTINEWLTAKRHFFDKEFITNNADPAALATEFGQINEQQKFLVFPTSNYKEAAIEINGNVISDFSQIPAAYIDTASVVKVLKENFKLIIPTEEQLHIIEMNENSSIKIGEDNKLKLLIGSFNFFSSINFTSSLAQFTPSSNNFSVNLKAELTTIKVKQGELKVTSGRDEEIILSGEYSTMNKKGKIKKPKQIKKPEMDNNLKKLEIPFLNF